MLAFRFGKTAGGQCVAAGNSGDICHCAAATVGIESDGILVRCRRCVLLEDSLDLHIAVRHEELIILDAHAAADDLPLLEAVARVWRSGQGDLRADYSFCRRCRSRSVAVIGDGDGVLGRCGFGYRNRQFLRIATRAVGSLDSKFGGAVRGRRAADFACIHIQTQASREIATVNAPYDRLGAVGGQGVAVCLAHLAVRQAARGDGGRSDAFADGKVVLRLAAIVPRAAQRHLGGLCRVEALVIRCEGVGLDVVGIDDRVVCPLRKRRIDILARLVGKLCQLLLAAVRDAVRQPLDCQKTILVAIRQIILAAERTFSVFVKAMVNGLSVNGAAADGDVFRRNTGQLLCVQVIINIVCAPLFRKPEGFHRAVQDLDPNLRSPAERIFPDAGNIVSVSSQIAALCGHGAVFNDDIYSTAAGVPRCADGGSERSTTNGHLTVRNADTALTIVINLPTVADGRVSA